MTQRERHLRQLINLLLGFCTFGPALSRVAGVLRGCAVVYGGRKRDLAPGLVVTGVVAQREPQPLKTMPGFAILISYPLPFSPPGPKKS